MTEPGDVGEQEQQPPSRWKTSIFDPAAANPPDQVHESNDQRRNKKQPKKRMGEAAMVGESKNCAFEAGENVKVGCFRRQGHGGGGERSLAVKTGSSQAGAGQEVGNGFQSFAWPSCSTSLEYIATSVVGNILGNLKTFAQPEARNAILRRLGNLRVDSPRLWGRMSAHQTICHLSDSLSSMMGERPISTLRRSTALKWPALYLPFPWPRGIKTRPEVDQFVGGTKPADFAVDMASLLILLERIASPTPDFTWQPHPIFGPLSQWQWMRWAYLHADHHLRQFGQ